MNLSRFQLEELSLRRIGDAVRRRVEDIPQLFSWYFSAYNNSFNLRNLEKFHNIHKGERCFIVGNGPSLKKMDLSLLNNEYSFGMNRIYLLFENTTFRPTYYVASNELVLEQFVSDISSLKIPKFLNWNRRKYFPNDDNQTMFFKVNFGINDFFGTDPRRPICGGGTVTYVAMQLAYFMGFQEVILIGVDHNFADKGTPNITEVRRAEKDDNHFHPSYFPKGALWQLPDLRHSEAAYRLARKTFEGDGRKILDATIGGKCPVFQKVDFYSLF